MGDFKVVGVSLKSETRREYVVPAWVPETLAKTGIHFTILACQTSEEFIQRGGDADVVWGSDDGKIVNAETLPSLTRCGAILRSGSGTDMVPVTVATQLGMLVVNTPEALSESVSDHAVGLMLAVVRQIPRHDRAIRNGLWDSAPAWPRRSLKGQVLGLVGFGHVARKVRQKMSGFGMTFLAYDPKVSDEVIVSQGVRAAGLDEVFSQSDIVSLHCPLTRETRHMVDAARLKRMKPTAILVNTSRGAVIDEPALVYALTAGWIAAAGLDVLEQEPTDPVNPLLKLDNVVITPHSAAASEGVDEAALQLSVEAIIALAQGRWPRSYVNPEVHPRWALS